MGVIAKYKFNQNTYENFIPEFNSGFNNYTITDEIDTDGYTVRTIESNNLPTLMQFGNNIANNKTKSLLSILKCNTENIRSMRYMFSQCNNLTSLDLSNFNTSRVTDMYSMFQSCSKLTSLDLSNFNTSKVTDMGHMFYGCSKLTSLDLYSFDTSKVTSNDYIFAFITSSTTIYLNPKTWNIDVSSYSAKFIRVARYKYTIAKYTFNNTAGDCLPTITGATTSQWSYSDEVDGTTTTRTIGTDEELVITQYSFYGCDELSTVEYLRIDSNITTLQELFYHCSNLTYINTTNWDVSNVQSTKRMCCECGKLKSIDLSNLNFAKVQDMSYMFSWCMFLDTVGFNSFIAKPTDTSYLFHNCSRLKSLNVSTLDTSLVVNMDSMFYNCSNLTSLDVSKFDTSVVTDMQYMFAQCKSLTSLDIKNFNTQSVMEYKYMFYKIEGIDVYIGKNWTLDVSSYNDINFIRLVTYLYTLAKYTFDNSIADCLPTITGANTNQWGYADVTDNTITTRTIGTDEELTITNISFQNKTSLLTLDYLNFTNAITDATNMFNGCTALTSINALDWNTSKVSKMNYMFSNCAKLTTLDLSSWKVDNVTDMSFMFRSCKSLTTPNLSNWNTSKVSNMSYMFRDCSALTTLDLSHFKVDSVAYMDYMFQNCSSLTSLNMSNWNTSKLTGMGYTFSGCSALTTLELSHFNVDNVAYMDYIFQNCSSLTSLNMSNWNTSKVSKMNYMFSNCAKLTTLDLSHFKVDSVTNMSYMFRGCSSLITLDLSNWKVDSVTDMNNMFSGCNALTMLDISNFDTSKVTVWGSFSANKLTNIGLVYASSSTINSIVTKWLGTSVARNVYYMDAEPSELTTQTNITYVPYSQSVLSCNEEITLRSNGDVYDELDLLTGQVIQRIGEDNEILEEEIIRTVELDGEIGFYENSYIHTSSNEITPKFEFQPTLTNCYVVSDLKPNTQYTVLFEGNPTLMSLGGTTIENPISKTVIISGEVDNILWFDTSVSKIMILEGDLTNRNVEYFTGVKSSQKIEVQLRGDTPYFAKGGRK